MSEELKPCPFCGAPDPRLGWIGNYQFIICDGCGSKTTNLPPGKAGICWNRRPSPWIPVSERLPEIHAPVIGFGGGYFNVVMFDADHGFIETGNSDGIAWPVLGVTHWMPLPDAPEGD